MNEHEVSRNASEANPASYSCVDRVWVQRQEDHEEARDTEHHWEEERDLWTSQELLYNVIHKDDHKNLELKKVGGLVDVGFLLDNWP